MADVLRGPFDVYSDTGGNVWLNGTLFGMNVCAKSENSLRSGMKSIASYMDTSNVDVDSLLKLSKEMKEYANLHMMCVDNYHIGLRLCEYADRILESLGDTSK